MVETDRILILLCRCFFFFVPLKMRDKFNVFDAKGYGQKAVMKLKILEIVKQIIHMSTDFGLFVSADCVNGRQIFMFTQKIHQYQVAKIH